MRKMLLAVAPVSHSLDDVPEGVANPLTPEEVAADVIECARKGASMAHLHVRDAEGKPTSELSAFATTLDLIRAESDIVLQGSTGGIGELSREERCVALNDQRVEVASLNMGSTNLGEEAYVNTLPDIRFWAGRMSELGVLPELCVFDLSMIATVSKLHAEGLVEPPFSFNFGVGFENALAASADHLFSLKNALPPESHWGVIHRGMQNLGLLATAAGMGASVLRVGYEDSFQYKEGAVAGSNAELVDELVTLLLQMDIEPMSGAEARDLLELPAPD